MVDVAEPATETPRPDETEPESMFRPLSLRELGKVLGVSKTKLDSLRAEGMPVAVEGGRGTPAQYDIGQVVKWYTGYAERRAEEAARRPTTAEDLAQLFGVSYTTIRNWRTAGLPCAREGSQGIAAEYDIGVVVRWYAERERARALAESPEGQLASIDLEMRRIDLAERREQVISVAESFETITAVLKSIQNGMNRFVSELDKQPGMTPAAIEAIEKSLDSPRRYLADELRAAIDGLADRQQDRN